MASQNITEQINYTHYSENLPCYRSKPQGTHKNWSIATLYLEVLRQVLVCVKVV